MWRIIAATKVAYHPPSGTDKSESGTPVIYSSILA